MLLSLFVLALLQPSRPLPVPVFITSVGATPSLPDPNPDNRDSVADLIEVLKGDKRLRLVAATDTAVIVLTVQNRDSGIAGIYKRKTLRVTLTCGQLTQELTGSALGGMLASGGAWHGAAKKIGKQVVEWIDTHRQEIAAIQK